MATILHIETATAVCSAAIAKSGELVLERGVSEPRQHISQLSPLVQKTLETIDMTYGELDAIAVSRGPGSYTGLRVGYATAKGLCLGLDIPLIEVDTLYSLAWGMKHQQGFDLDIYLPMIDARRMEVYCAHFDHQLNEIRPHQAWIVTAEDVLGLVASGKSIGFCGNGAFKVGLCSLELEEYNNLFINELNCNSSLLVARAWAHYQAGRFADLAYAEPFYLKPPNITTPRKKIG